MDGVECVPGNLHITCFRNIPTIRKRFDDVSKTGSLDPDKKLFV